MGFPCRYCQSRDTLFIKEQFDENGAKLGELWRCKCCQKNFRVLPEDKFKNRKKDK